MSFRPLILLAFLLQSALAQAASAPAKIEITYGDGQYGIVLNELTSLLQVQVTDVAGIPVSHAAVVWSVTQGEATIAPQAPTTDANGLVYAAVTFKGKAGTVLIKAAVSGTSLSVLFSEYAHLATAELRDFLELSCNAVGMRTQDDTLYYSKDKKINFTHDKVVPTVITTCTKPPVVCKQVWVGDHLGLGGTIVPGMYVTVCTQPPDVCTSKPGTTTIQVPFAENIPVAVPKAIGPLASIKYFMQITGRDKNGFTLSRSTKDALALAEDGGSDRFDRYFQNFVASSLVSGAVFNPPADYWTTAQKTLYQAAAQAEIDRRIDDKPPNPTGNLDDDQLSLLVTNAGLEVTHSHVDTIARPPLVVSPESYAVWACTDGTLKNCNYKGSFGTKFHLKVPRALERGGTGDIFGAGAGTTSAVASGDFTADGQKPYHQSGSYDVTYRCTAAVRPYCEYITNTYRAVDAVFNLYDGLEEDVTTLGWPVWVSKTKDQKGKYEAIRNKLQGSCNDVDSSKYRICPSLCHPSTE
jgi:hypothetical protein